MKAKIINFNFAKIENPDAMFELYSQLEQLKKDNLALKKSEKEWRLKYTDELEDKNSLIEEVVAKQKLLDELTQELHY